MVTDIRGFSDVSRVEVGALRLPGHLRLPEATVGLVLIACMLQAYAAEPVSIDPARPFVHSDRHGREVDLFLWHPRYRERCLFQNQENPRNEHVETVERLLDLLKNDPEFYDYLMDKAAELGVAFCIDDRHDGSRGFYDYKFNILVLKDSLAFLEKYLILVHELRHVDHVSRGFSQSIVYDIEEMARLTYAIEADAQAMAVLHAWRMKEKGFPEVWAALSEFERYADIVAAFEAEIDTGGDEPQAARAAFVQWYRSRWRTDGYYKGAYMGYLDMLDETKMIRKFTRLPDEYFDHLCVLPSGENYDCHGTEEIGIDPGAEYRSKRQPEERQTQPDG